MPKVGENLDKEQSIAGLKRLKPQQQDFLNNYLHKDMTQTQAAREAGYKNATVAAVRLLKNPVVQERLSEMRLEAQARYGVTLDKSIRDLKEMRDQAWQEGNINAALRAEELRLKAAGLLVNKQHILKEELTSGTREEILKKLDDFKRLAEGRMKQASGELIEHGEIVADNETNP